MVSIAFSLFSDLLDIHATIIVADATRHPINPYWLCVKWNLSIKIPGASE